MVKVDGRSRELLNIGGWLGVKSLEGTHTYEFTFTSTTFIIGTWISLLTLLVLAAILASGWLAGLRKSPSFIRLAFERIRSRPQKRSGLPQQEISPALRVPLRHPARAVFSILVRALKLKSIYPGPRKRQFCIQKPLFHNRRAYPGQPHLSLALAQINTTLGDPQANLEKHLALAREAKKDGCDLIVFPELSLTGYVLQDLVPSVAASANAEDPIFRHLIDASQEIDLVVGFVDEDTRHRFYIASAYLSAGEVLHVHHKVYLPTYGLFDEGRFFAPG